MVPLHVLRFLSLVLCLPVILSQCILLTEHDALNNYLYGPNHILLPDTQILFNDVDQILSSSSFCLVSNTLNITIHSTSETHVTIVVITIISYISFSLIWFL